MKKADRKELSTSCLLQFSAAHFGEEEGIKMQAFYLKSITRLSNMRPSAEQSSTHSNARLILSDSAARTALDQAANCP